MALTLEQLREEIVALAPKDRQTLLDSVFPAQEFATLGLHADWEEEIRFRLEESSAGRMDTVSLQQFEEELNQQAALRTAAK